jgi:regulator of protease activity HflC (stomatin/prohibitin superfamily)
VAGPAPIRHLWQAHGTRSRYAAKGGTRWKLIIAFGIVLAIESIKVVPQQQAWVVERFGKFHAVLEPGLNGIWPFFDRVAYKHSLKEVPLDVSEQVCITKDNTRLGVDGIIYYQVTDPRLASYGSSNYIAAITIVSSAMTIVSGARRAEGPAPAKQG